MKETQFMTGGKLAAVFLTLIVFLGLVLTVNADARTDIAGQWLFDEGSGQIAADSSANGNHGYLGLTPDADGYDPFWTEGIFGTPGLYFDGNNAVTVPDAISLEPQVITVEAWVRGNGSPGIYRYIVAKGAAGCTCASYALYSGPSGGLYFYICNSAFVYYLSPDAGQGVWDGLWHHVAGTFDGSTVRLYVDGTEIGNGTAAPVQVGYDMPTHDNLYIGTYRGACVFPFRGDIDEVTVWNRVLSPIEIAERAQGGGACSNLPSGIVSWWPLNDTFADIIDGNHPAAVNGVVLTAGKVGNGALFGSGGYIDIPHSENLVLQRFTVNAWVRPDGPGPNNDFPGSVIVQKNLEPPTGNIITSVALWWDAIESRFHFAFGDYRYERITSANTFAAGEFYHVAATYDGSVFKLYVDGQLEAERAYVKTIPYTSLVPWTIGSTYHHYRTTGWARTWNGMIDEVEIYDRALSFEEIYSMYAAGSAGRCDYINHYPIAHAGQDQVIECPATEAVQVTLDGSGSYDPDPSRVTYAWTGPFGTAYGVSPTVTLPYWGTWTIPLTVDDGYGGTDTDEVVITVGDTIAPVTTASVVGVLGDNGWYVSDVTVTLTSTDSCTGIREIHYVINGVEYVHYSEPGLLTDSVTFTLTEDGVYEITFWAVDNAGRVGRTGTTSVPAAPSSGGSSGGYYTGCVNVSLQEAEGPEGEVLNYSLDGGITWIPYTGEFVICQDGPNEILYGYAPPANNVEQPQTIVISIDQTPPVITITGVVDGETYSSCAPPTPDYTVVDATSGVASQSAELSGGNANGVGTYTYTVTATDNAGNTAVETVTYRVTYLSPGTPLAFQAPVTLGKPFKQGSTIPVKFVLTDSCGYTVSSAVATISLQLYSGDQPSGDPLDGTSNVPDSGNQFRFSASDALYIYNLSTDPLSVGTWKAVVTLDDGTTHEIMIGIK